MRMLQSTAAMFCIACICAEVTALLVGRGWARKCIKATAGLYILVVFFHVLPRIKANVIWPAKVSGVVAPFQNTEGLLLDGTRKRLQASLQQDCLQRFGRQTELEIVLRQEKDRIEAERVTMYVPPGSSESEYAEAASYLYSLLGVKPEVRVREDTP